MVVPTLGRRLDTLEESLASIRGQEASVDIVLVAPDSANIQRLALAADATWLLDPGSQAAAINAGVRTAGKHHDFVGWLNDDDLLEVGSLSATMRVLDSRPGAVLAYGACRYIDPVGHELWISRAREWAPRILKWGPDLIPQPGMLMRRSAWDHVGGVNETMRFAFDLDLLLRIQPLGEFVDVGQIVSSFRWHADSLTVSDRTASLKESEAARRRALSPAMRRMAWAWEGPVRVATRAASWELNRRAARLSETAR